MRLVQPGAVRALAVLHLVAGQRRAAVPGRCRPAHVQARGRARGRPHRRRRRLRRLLGRVGHVDRHRDAVRPATAVRHLDRHRVARLRLVVVDHTGLRAQLTARRHDVERGRVRSRERVLKGVACVRIGGRHRATDVRPRRVVLRHRAGRARAFGERRRAVARIGGAARARRGPRARRLPVERPHPRLVGRARGEPRDRRARARTAVRLVQPGAVRALAVLHLVAGQRRAAVPGRCRPAHVQARGRARGRPHRRRRRLRRLLGRVGHVDRHRDAVRPATAVRHLDRHRVARLRLVVVDHTGLRAQLTARRHDVERGRVRSRERVLKGVACVRIGGRHRATDVRPRRVVLRHRAGRARAFGERRRAVARIGGAARARRGPRARRLPVERPHPRLVGRARGEPRDRRARARTAVRLVQPGAVRALAVLHLVAGQRRAAVPGRCRPAHVQARGRARGRPHRRRRRLRRLLGRVGHVDRHRDAVRPATAVRHLDRHRVARLRLVVVDHTGLRAQLTARRHDVERGRVRSRERVLKGVACVRIGGRHRATDVRPRRVVLRHRAGRARAFGERRRVVGGGDLGALDREPRDGVGDISIRSPLTGGRIVTVHYVADAPAEGAGLGVTLGAVKLQL